MKGRRDLTVILAAVLQLWLVVSLLHAQQPVSASYTKMGADGKELPLEAEQWAMVRDNSTGLIWEVKTTDGSIHDRDRVFDWKGAEEEFIAELNRQRFGGFSDWRLPTTDELRGLTLKGAEPFINQEFFPNTAPTGYLSWRKCGSGEIFDERVKFGEERNTKKNRRVRAVRSGSVGQTP